MAIKVRNLGTGEVREISNTGLMDGKLFVFGKNEPTRWASKYEFFKLTGNVLASGAYNKYEIEFVDGMGYELCAAGTKPARTRKPQPKPEPEPIPQPQPEPKEKEITGHTEPEPIPQPTPQPQPTFNVGGLEGGLAAVFAPVFNQVAQQIEANVRAKVDAEMSELKRVAEEKARVLKIELPDGREGKVDGLTMDGFDDMVKDLEEGYNIYMYGPAGTGKSHTAKQLAEALGLPYYELNQVEFAHEVCGYGDAAIDCDWEMHCYDESAEERKNTTPIELYCFDRPEWDIRMMFHKERNDQQGANYGLTYCSCVDIDAIKKEARRWVREMRKK